MDLNKRPDDMARITTKELAEKFIDEQVKAVREQVGDKNVLLALSGGVDSSVVAALLIKAIGKQLICVHVNHGLMRKGESEEVVEVFRNQLDANLVYVDATDRFLDKLADVEDPETKRKIIGGEFIRVFEEEARKVADVDFLHLIRHNERTYDVHRFAVKDVRRIIHPFVLIACSHLLFVERVLIDTKTPCL